MHDDDDESQGDVHQAGGQSSAQRTSAGHRLIDVDAPSTSAGHRPFDLDAPSTSAGHGQKRTLNDSDNSVVVDNEEDGDQLPMYHISKVSQRRIKKYKANLTDYTVSFRSVENQGPMLDMIPRIKDMFANIVDEVLADARDRDMVRVVVNAPQLDKPVQLPFIRRNQFDRDMLGSRLESVLQSHEEISLDENLEFNVLHMEMPEGEEEPGSFWKMQKGYKKQMFHSDY